MPATLWLDDSTRASPSIIVDSWPVRVSRSRALVLNSLVHHSLLSTDFMQSRKEASHGRVESKEDGWPLTMAALCSVTSCPRISGMRSLRHLTSV